MHPADFYTGLVADLYRPLRAHSFDPAPYRAFIQGSGQPALELGCGDGDPLLALRAAGLDVEGVDSSADMLDRCRRNAARAGLDVVLHHQRMEALDLPRRYRSIFLAGPTFTLLADDDTALRALTGIRTHLADGGTALVPLFLPAPTPAGQIGRVREARDEDGAVLRFSVLAEERDEAARSQRTLARYERRTGAGDTVLERPWILHWYTRDQFRALAAAAGLDVVAIRDAAPDEFTVVLART